LRLLRDTCRSIRDLLPLHVGGDLNASQARRVDEHLHLCLSCFREFRELATMRGRLGVLAEQPLPAGVLGDFTEQVMARIAMGEEGPAAELPGVRRRLVLPLRPLAAAAALVMALSLGLVLGSQWLTKSPDGNDAQPSGASGVVADVPGLPEDIGYTLPTSLPSLGIPVGDFQAFRVIKRPPPESGFQTISSRDQQYMDAFIPALRPALLNGTVEGLVPDTDSERQLRPRQPGLGQDG
jgi:hypothetical protein